MFSFQLLLYIALRFPNAHAAVMLRSPYAFYVATPAAAAVILLPFLLPFILLSILLFLLFLFILASQRLTLRQLEITSGNVSSCMLSQEYVTVG
jgi:hypothetical protein